MNSIHPTSVQEDTSILVIFVPILIIALTTYDYLKSASKQKTSTLKEANFPTTPPKSNSKSPRPRPNHQSKIVAPTGITSPAVMEAATEEIKQHIAEHGSISPSESDAIIQQKVAVMEKLWSIFPGAMSSEDVLDGFKNVLEKRGYTDDNTLFAQSVCPDEVNHEEGDITDLFTKHCGEVFHMGGLAGMPFTGKVGFGAFSHHVPDGGHCAVLMAPHIGMDNEGKFGAYSRDGQAHSGSCCGAAVGAYSQSMQCHEIPTVAPDAESFQFDYIVQQVTKHKKEIIGNTDCEKQASLVLLLHRLSHNMLKRCIGLNFGDEKSTLVIVTGIQINMPRPFDDFFLPLEFYIMKKDGTMEDVFEEAFGPRSL